MTTSAICAMRDEEIVRRRQYGDAIKKIASDLGVPFGTVGYVVAKHGVKGRDHRRRDTPLLHDPYIGADAILAAEEARVEARLSEVRRRLAWNAQWWAEK